MKVIHTKSIPNVDADRLIDSIWQIHYSMHTQDGLHLWEKTRRGMIDLCLKNQKIIAGLITRFPDEVHRLPDCRFCTRSTT